MESIKSLPEKAQDQLGNDFRDFQRVGPEKQLQMQKLQQELDDPANSSLKDVMYVYSAWLKTLEPEELAELKKITHPDRRLDKIKELLSRPTKRNQSTSSRPGESGSEPSRNKPRVDGGKPDGTFSGGANFGNQGTWGARQNFLVLPPEDFLRAIGMLESLAAPTFEKDQRRMLDSQKGYLRHIKLVELLMRQELNDKGGPPRWAQDSKAIDDLVAGISDRDIRQFLQKDDNPERKRRLLLVSVAQSLRSDHGPNDAKLEQFMQTLPPDVQDQLKTLRPEAKKSRVYELYVMSHPKEFPATVLEFQRLARQLVQKFALFGKGPGKGDGRPVFRNMNPEDKPFRRRFDNGSGSEFKPREPADNRPADGERPPQPPEK